MTKEEIGAALWAKYPQLEPISKSIISAADMLINCYSKQGKVLLCGNGGSSADADHITGELMKSFELKRPLDESLSVRLAEIGGRQGKILGSKLENALPAICLTSQTSLTTAIANDIGNDLIYAQQIIGYGNENDVLIALSTSGNSPNIVSACITASALNLVVIGLTGKSGGRMKDYCDILINVPEKETAMVQELHLPVLHAICRIVENHFYGK